MPSIQLRLFGGFQVNAGELSLVGFSTDKVRALFAYLAVETGRPHRRDALAGLLWPDQPEADARRNLRKAVFQLKEALAMAGSDGMLTVTRQTIELDPGHLELDVAEFRTALEFTAAHPHSALSDCPTCLAFLDRAATLYRGSFLEGFFLKEVPEFEAWQLQRQEEMGQEVQRAYETLGEAHWKRGEFTLMEKAARSQLVLDPYRESAHRRLMRAAAAQGNRAAALAKFETFRRILEEELGVSPDEETTALYTEIETGSLAIPPPSVPRLHNFPAQTTRFIGRAAEIDGVLTRLSEIGCRLVSLIGPGGVGKSRLAIEAGRVVAGRRMGFPDGVFWVPLAGTASVSNLETAIGMGTGASFSTSGPPRQILLTHLRAFQALLVLDNFEHLSDGTALVTEILEACPGVKVLATSREPLNLKVEWRFFVEGLAYPTNGELASRDGQSIHNGEPERFEAVELFTHLIDRLHPNHQPCEDPEWIVEICRVVNGMPLALEMAAALTRVHRCEQLAAEIVKNLDVLSIPYRDVPDRHRSMRAVFEHSWALLDDPERSTLVRLAVFQNGISAVAALDIVGADGAVLAGLVDRSMLQRIRFDRYTLHPLLQQYLEEKLSAAPGFDSPEANPRSRHARFFLGMVARNASALGTGTSVDAQAEIRLELDNIRNAWKWAIKTGMVAEVEASIHGLMRYYMLSGLIQERETVTGESARILESLGGLQDPGIARTLHILHYFNANSRGLLGNVEAALEPAFESLRLAHQLEDPGLIASAQGLIGHLFQDLGDYHQALRYQEDALRLLGEEIEPGRKALLLIRLATACYRTGLLDRAHSSYAEAHSIYKDLGYQPGMADALSGMGIVAAALNRHREALDYYLEAEQIDVRLGNKASLARHAANAGNSLRLLGEDERALEAYRKAIALKEESGSLQYAGVSLTGTGRIFNKRGLPAEALEWFERAIAISRDAGYRFDQTEALIEKAQSLLTLLRKEEAQTAFHEAVDLAGKLDLPALSFRIQLLQAGIEAAFNRADAVAVLLERMLQDFTSDEERVEILAQLERLPATGPDAAGQNPV